MSAGCRSAPETKFRDVFTVFIPVFLYLNRQIKVSISSVHADGSQVKSRSPKNISGASQQNKLAAFCNEEEEEEEEEEEQTSY